MNNLVPFISISLSHHQENGTGDSRKMRRVPGCRSSSVSRITEGLDSEIGMYARCAKPFGHTRMTALQWKRYVYSIGDDMKTNPIDACTDEEAWEIAKAIALKKAMKNPFAKDEESVRVYVVKEIQKSIDKRKSSEES